MPYLPTPTPTQGYIITHNTQDLVRGFRSHLDGNDSRIARELISVLGKDRFIANASFVENRRVESKGAAFQLDGFTTHAAHLEFYEPIQEQLIKFAENKAQEQGVSLEVWLKDVSNRFDSNSPLKDIDGNSLAILFNYQEINDPNHDLLWSAVSVEVLEIFCGKFMAFVEQAIEEEMRAKRITIRTNKGLTMLFLSSQPLEIARIAHCIVNHIDYDGFVTNARLLTDPTQRKDGWIIGFSNKDATTNFFKEHQPKIKEWLEHITLMSGENLLSLLGNIDTLKPFIPNQIVVLRRVILNNDTSCKEYEDIAQAIVIYLNERISADFIEFSKNKEPVITKTTVYVGGHNPSPSLADSVNKYHQKSLDKLTHNLNELDKRLTDEDKYQLAYKKGYEQAKADILATSIT